MGPVIFITGNQEFSAHLITRKFASMGPVIFITGNVSGGCAVPPGFQRRFNGAGDLHHRKRRGLRLVLPELDASMGPVIFITGNKCRRSIGRDADVRASMGPVIFITGNAGSRPWNPSRAPCFNGAGDLHHRKRAHGRTNRAWLDPASMGPVIFITGNSPDRRPRARRRSARFNGAGDLHHRKRHETALPQCGATGFNGAGDLHHRKRVGAGREARDERMGLQWGR